MRIRRALLATLSDAAYDTVQSFHSDSAVCFSLFLHQLPDLTSLHPPHVLLRALEAGFFPFLRSSASLLFGCCAGAPLGCMPVHALLPSGEFLE